MSLQKTPPSSPKSEANLGRVLKYTGLFGGVQGIYVLLALLRNKFSAIFLKTAGMGLLEGYVRSAEMIGSATNFGVAFSAVQHISRLYESGNEVAIFHYVRLVRSWVMLAALLGGLITALLSPLWSYLMFESFSHTLPFIALSPLVAISTVSGGEMAVLKGLRCLRSIAFVSTVGAFLTLVISVSFYWQWGVGGIIPALVLSSFFALVLQLHRTHRHVPYVVCLTSWRFLRRGYRMVRLGLAYALSGFIAAGGEVVVRSLLFRMSERVGLSGMEAVGIYAAGFTLTVSYARLILMSMDADYYPRLSAASTDVVRQNVAVNRQIEVLVLLMAPFLILFCILLPFLVQLLYTSEFAAAVPMVVAASLYMFFKAVSTPIAYLALARARSRLYLMVESSYSLFFVLFVGAGFYYGGFSGAGLGLSASYAVYLGVVWHTYRRHFGFSFESGTLRRTSFQLLFLLSGIGSVFLPSPFNYLSSACCLFASLTFSWRLLKREVRFVERVSERFRSLFRKTDCGGD